MKNLVGIMSAGIQKIDAKKAAKGNCCHASGYAGFVPALKIAGFIGISALLYAST